MVWKIFVQTIPGEPANRLIYLSLTHQLAVMDNPLEKTSQDQAQRALRIYTRTTIRIAGAITHRFAKPGQIQYSIDTCENMIVWNKILAVPRDKQGLLSTVLMTYHSASPQLNFNPKKAQNPV
jgi:hypothetical protein